MPLISIVLCSYNGGKFISKQLDSILNQTVEDFELIICDDQSKDSTLEIINSFIENDKRIKLHINSENLGYVKNFEKGISLAKGDYIALSDQDDIWELDKIEKLLNNINEHALIYCDSLFVDSNLQPIGKKTSSSKEMINANDGINLSLFNCVSGHALLFKKELKQYIFPFPKLIPHDWWIAFLASFHGGIVYFNEALVKYRIHDENALVLNKNRKSIENKVTKRQIRIREFYNACPDRSSSKPVLLELNDLYQNITFLNKFKKIALFFKHKEALFAINKKKGFSRIHYILRQFNKLI